MKVSYFLMLLIASVTIIFTSCTDDPKPITHDKCAGNTCASEGKVCDPGSGACVATKDCKNACKTDETCNTVTGKCESNTIDLCEGNTCSDTQICDPTDGSCKDFNVDDIDTIVKARKYSSANGDQTGIILTKPLEGVVVAVKGLKTSTHHAVIIEQSGETEYAGIYVNLDGIKAEADFKDLAVGNLVSIKGKLDEYYTRTELYPQTTADVTITSDSVTLPTPVDLSSASYEEKYESMLVNLTNVPLTITDLTNVVSCGAGDSCTTGNCSNGICPGDSKFTYTATDSNGKKIEIGTSFSYPRVKFTSNENITMAKGVITMDYSEIVLFPRSQEDVGQTASVCDPACGTDEMCVNSKCVAKVSENTDALCSDGIDNDNDGHTDCDDFDCSKSATVTVCAVKCGDVTCASGEVCVNNTCTAPTSEDTDTLCSDGIDNDGNGHTDCEDWSCSRNPNVTVCAVTCAGVTCAAGETCVNDVCTASTAENTEALCSDGIDNDNDGHIDCDDFDCNNTTVCGTTSDCTPACTNGQVCNNGTCEDIQTVSISDVRAGTIGNTYSTSGTITALDAKGFYMQDANAGIYIYLNNTPTQSVADVVTVTGTSSEYKNFLELKNATVTVDSQGTLPAPISVDATTVGETQESMYVSFTGQPFTVTSSTQYDFTITDSNTKTFLLKNNTLSSSLVVGNVLSKLDGVISQYNNSYRLVLRDANDMALVNFTCATPCESWETCTATDTCTTTPGMCNVDNSECGAGYSCDNHVCVEVISNNLVNGDLESWTSGVADNWNIDSDITVTQEDTKFHGGAHSAKVSRKVGAGNSATDFTSAKFTIDGSKNYTISAYVLDETTAVKGRLYYALYNASGDQIGGMNGQTGIYTTGVDTTTGWEELTTTINDSVKFWTIGNTTFTAADIASISVGIRVYKDADGDVAGDVYLDDVTVTEVQ